MNESDRDSSSSGDNVTRRRFLGAVGAAAVVSYPGLILADDKKKPTTGAGVDVPMFRGNPSHTHYGTGPIADKLAVRWKYKMGVYVSPAAAHRKERKWIGTGWTGTAIYVGGKVIIGSLDSKLYCFDAATGKVQWTYKGAAMFKS